MGGVAGLVLRGAGLGVGRPVPAGRWSRFWTLGTLQGKIAAAYTFWWLRGMWQGADARERGLNEAHLRAAVQLLGTMSYLRGAVMKLGQVIAAWPGVAPQEFADLLGRLYFQAPPMHFSLLREQVRNELGAEPEELFESFETEAVAAASLGQVHRARLKGSGRMVAVKVQYPGIARAIRGDVTNIRALVTPMRLGQDGASILAQLGDIEEMLALETDYRREAENLRDAARLVEGIGGVVAPGVHEDVSSDRVLTMDWLDGVHLEGWLAGRPEQAERDRMGSLIVRCGMRMCYSGHMLYGDPSPGNYLFLRDGRLGLIDFGCVRRYTPEEVDYLVEAERAMFESRESVRKALVRGADLTAKQQGDAERLRLMEAWYDWMNEPAVREGLFDFGDPAYFRRGMEIWGELMRRRYARALPVNTWITRNFVGIRAMLQRMGARVEYGRILGEETTVERAGDR
jgi:predicted unusual protein kinase regulating ubiquinone biosynthesis (AarF/ABC1/UbiB family)